MEKFYFVGSASWHIDKAMQKAGIQNTLYSYYYIQDKPEEWINKFPHMFIDSGAFSAENQGEEISLDEYAEFLKEWGMHENVDLYANLDVIGDAEETYENQKKLEDKGLSPAPIFHIGSDFKYLKRYVEEGYDRILLGGMVGGNTNDLINFCAKAMKIIPEDVKVHAFGVGRPSVLEKFDFYSADASNWTSGGRYGHMAYFDRGEMHKYDKTEFAERFTEMSYKKIHLWNCVQWKNYAEHLGVDEV